MTDTKYIAAAQKLQALGYEWKGDEWVKPAPPVKYGCHCDLDLGDEPDGCVLDYSRPGVAPGGARVCLTSDEVDAIRARGEK